MPRSGFGKLLGLGSASGLAATAVMFAMRTFDQTYAPQTVAKSKADPGQFVVGKLEKLIGQLPETIEKSAALSTHLGYGTLFGALYALWRGRHRKRSSLADGIGLGLIVYAVGDLGWLPAVGLTRPAWKQPFPQIGGELLRHVAYGIATTSSFGLLEKVI